MTITPASTDKIKIKKRYRSCAQPLKNSRSYVRRCYCSKAYRQIIFYTMVLIVFIEFFYRVCLIPSLGIHVKYNIIAARQLACIEVG